MTIINKIDVPTLLKKADVEKRFVDVLGKNTPAFLNTLISISQTTELKDCDPKSILGAALTSATLGLPINQNLGFAFIVPYLENKKGTKIAQFQMGYKGYIQLAIRSGKISQLNVGVLGTSQFKGYDYIEDILYKDLSDTTDLTPCVYVGKLKLINGFTKYLVKTKEDLLKHAQKYSKLYQFNKTKSLWHTNFDCMAKKTVLKELLNKYAPLSSTLQYASSVDQASIIEDKITYPDNNCDIDINNKDISLEDNTEPKVIKNEAKSQVTNPNLEEAEELFA